MSSKYSGRPRAAGAAGTAPGHPPLGVFIPAAGQLLHRQAPGPPPAWHSRTWSYEAQSASKALLAGVRGLSGAGRSGSHPRAARGNSRGALGPSRARRVPQPRNFPSALRALPVLLQPRRALLTAGTERGLELKLPLPRERNFIFMCKMCDLWKASTAACAFIY